MRFRQRTGTLPGPMTMALHHSPSLIHGCGLGLRRPFLGEVVEDPPAAVDFYEVAPENWMRLGGRPGRQFRALTERFPFVCHGLSLSLGGPAPLDEAFLRELKGFLDTHRIRLYSEHLSYCGDAGHLYDLLPLPFTSEAVRHVAARIRRVQDILERPIAIENVSFYAMQPGEMDEIDFLDAVLREADCALHLDVNNIYVNAQNHGFDPLDYLRRVPTERIVYAHIAGHWVEGDGLIIDTHGEPVIDPVWALLDAAYALHGSFATCLERDFNLPPLAELLAEVGLIRAAQLRAEAARPRCSHG